MKRNTSATVKEDGGDIETEFEREIKPYLKSKIAERLEKLRSLRKPTGERLEKKWQEPIRIPKTMAQAHQTPEAKHWAKAYDAEIYRHDTDLHTRNYEKPEPYEKPLPFATHFKAKTNQFGEIEKFKVRCAIRGDKMRPGKDFDETRTASNMPSQTARRLLIAGAVSDGHDVQFWDVTGAYMRASNNSNLRVTMVQLPRSDGTYKEPGKLCVMRRAMQGDPSANEQWDCRRDFW